MKWEELNARMRKWDTR